MSRRSSKKGRPRTQERTGPTFALPADLPKRQRKQLERLVKDQIRDAIAARKVLRPFRFRYQLMPLGWLASMAAALVCHLFRAYTLAAIGGLLMVMVTVLVTRHRPPFVRYYQQGMACWAATWQVILALAGLGPWAAVALIGWAVPSAFWVQRHRWRPPDPDTGEPEPEAAEIFAELCEAQNWHAALGPAQRLDAGGVRWPVICNGAKTHIGKLVSKPDEVAAAFNASVVQAYVEPREDGVRSRGWLTKLPSATLETPRLWDRKGIDPKTGLAVVGRFPEGGNVHERLFVPGIGGGARHTIIAGADGSGKTNLLDLGLAISVMSGVIAPVILDPQEGQALPAWREAVPYACGAEECMVWLRGLHAGMFAQSKWLSQLEWTDPRNGKVRKGMGFFDPWITGIPFVEITLDEAPVLLALKGAAELILDIAKLGRKVGYRLKLAAQVPSLSELKAQELRSILVGGNAYCLRTGDKVSSGYMNLPANPNELPKYWGNGQPTWGLGYADTIEQRPGVTMRADLIDDPWLVAESATPRSLPPLVAEHLRRAVALDADRVAGLQAGAAADATSQLRVLAALSRPMALGELIAACEGLAVSDVVDAVTGLEGSGQLRRAGDLLERVVT